MQNSLYILFEHKCVLEVCVIVMRGWQLYLRGPWVIRGSGGSCNKKYILINLRVDERNH